MTADANRLELDGIHKSFPGIKALDGVSLAVRPGEVHGLLGENGAGKSTLLNILAAVLPADAGEVRIDGRVVRLSDPGAARSAGIAMIHQELQHIPALSVAQNMFLGRPMTSAGGLFVNRRAQEQRARAILRDLDPDIDPARPIRELKVAQQQIVEIARALLDEARIIAMDEPTSSLTPAEFDTLAGLIGKLADAGVSIIYVSHKLEEVFRVCGRATILRDGKLVDTVALSEVDEAQVVTQMVGRDVKREAHTSHVAEEVVLRVEGLGDGGMIHDACFDLRRGEVLGVAGLIGSGRTELMRLVAGIERAATGRIVVRGTERTFRSPRDAIAAGIGLVPEERKREGIVHSRSVASNMALPSMRRFARAGLIRRRFLHREASRIMDLVNLRPPDVLRPIGQFSGGNQQKAIIGRWLAADIDILLFDEPTRGIDVGTKSEIYDRIEALAAEGKAIVVVSSELTEILRVSDRVLVMCEGRITATLSGADITEETIAANAIPQSKRRGTAPTADRAGAVP